MRGKNAHELDPLSHSPLNRLESSCVELPIAPFIYLELISTTTFFMIKKTSKWINLLLIFKQIRSSKGDATKNCLRGITCDSPLQILKTLTDFMDLGSVSLKFQ